MVIAPEKSNTNIVVLWRKLSPSLFSEANPIGLERSALIPKEIS
jgi:hypothetical protein